jgi:exodeoxyribonuclease V gamma subunit
VPAVATYLGTPADEIRRYQLARRLADVFDQYLIYRGDMLIRWENGDTPTTHPGRWQAAVWRWLIHSDHLGNTHRARLLRDFVAQLRTDQTLAAHARAYCPAKLYCFGLLALAPDQLRLLYALAEHIDVHFLLPNPSAQYWGDITAGRLALERPENEAEAGHLPGETGVEAGHSLLGSLGRMARDTLRVLYSDEFADLVDPELGAALEYRSPGRDCLLHRIQSDIIELDCGGSEQGMRDDDASFEIYACHTPLREVQVLQDQILDRLAADDARAATGEISQHERLAPRDIIVMLPNMADYAPAITAVFGGAPADRHLPFSLADRARSTTHPIITCIATLLDLPIARWTASEVLDLLAVPAVMRRFDLSAGELDSVTTWVREAGIRWGRDAAHRQELGAGHYGQNSWHFGLERLLLGVAQADAETLVGGVAPWADLEGHETAALGKLWRFATTLTTAATKLTEPATPGQWQTRLNWLLDALVEPARDEPEEQRAVDGLRTAFAQLEGAEENTRATPLGSDRRIAWEAMREHLRATLDSVAERQPFLSGGITFCGMVPLRAVPFGMVCILGLNDSAFPRQDRNQAFNVMFEQPRLGDRNTRDDDRLLFLQALTSARHIFYLSYIGQDPVSGEKRPPSPIIGETLEFIHRHYFHTWEKQDFEQRLIHEQPMQPFATRYFSQEAESDPRIFTYAGYWRAATQALVGPRQTRPPLLDDSAAPLSEPIEVLDLDALKRFFDHPPRAFFRDRLKLDLEITEREIEDTELTRLDKLAAYQLRQRLFTSADAANELAVDRAPGALELARGELPPPPLAGTDFANEADRVNALLPVWQDWQAQGTPATLDIDLTIEGVRLSGRIGQVWPGAVRRLRPGRLRTKYQLRYWIDYLAAVAAERDSRLEIAGFENKKDSQRVVLYGGCIDPAAARASLAGFIRLFIAGQQRPLAYHPDMDDEYSAHQNKAFDNFAHRFKASANHPHYLVHDPYFALMLGDDSAPLGTRAVDSPFIAAIDAVSGAMKKALQEERPAGASA